ncbi:MAG TPA: PAS domain-containing protein [Williamwhitmania sp.]|nr:PAS domain-containing protein [Williamwhitmania sp.]
MISFKKLRLTTKMQVLVLLTGIAVITLIGLFAGYRVRQMAVDSAIATVTKQAEKHAALIRGDLELDLGFSRALAQSMYGYEKIPRPERDSIYLNLLYNLKRNNPKYLYVWMNWEYSALRLGYKFDYGRESTSVYESHGDIVSFVEQKDTAGNNLESSYYKVKTTNKEAIIDPYPYSVDGIHTTMVTSVCVPIDKGGRFVGLAGVDIPLSKFQDQVASIHSYEGSLAFLVSNNGIIIAHQDPANVGKKLVEVYPDITLTNNLEKKIADGFGTQFYAAVNGTRCYIILRPVKVSDTDQPWSLGLIIPSSSIMQEARATLYISILVMILGLGLLAFVVRMIAKNITSPIMTIRDRLNIMALGDIDSSKKVTIDTGDELEELGNSLNSLVDGLNNAEVFAREIGKGNLNAEFNLLGSNDLLGKSLLDMRQSLKEAREQEDLRKEEEERQNWATKGLALFGDILRRNNDNLHELSYEIIQNLVTYLGANQGGVFVINDSDPSQLVLEMTASYAYDRRKFLEKTVVPGEGMVGRCFQERKRIYMTAVPNNYITITSGLGKENPSALLLIPMLVNDNIFGVIEIASFTKLPEYQIAFVEKVSESIAATISSTKINIRTAELLARAQQQAEELAAQEEEMRQNMEELQATQEEMERKRSEQEQLQQQLGEEKALLDALMLNIPDFVYFKDTNSQFIRISKSMVKLFMAQSPDDLIGKSDFDFHSKEHAQIAFNEEKTIMNSQKPIVDHVVHEQFDDGREQWVSTTKMPLFNDHGEVVGTWGISKIVTELKQAEIIANSKVAEAEELHKKMVAHENEYRALASALNANTLVTYFTTEGVIISVNQPVLSMVDKNENEIVGHHHNEVFGMGESEEAQKELWSDLRKGIVVNRTYSRKVNGVKVVLHETYSPVENIDGLVEKVVCIATKES